MKFRVGNTFQTASRGIPQERRKPKDEAQDLEQLITILKYSSGTNSYDLESHWSLSLPHN